MAEALQQKAWLHVMHNVAANFAQAMQVSGWTNTKISFSGDTSDARLMSVQVPRPGDLFCCHVFFREAVQGALFNICAGFMLMMLHPQPNRQTDTKSSHSVSDCRRHYLQIERDGF